uniref:Remorin 4.1 n=1 Tax=Elaeis guineensis var. tenera TaxID=51953 RepID=A0A6J0PHB4_ELAGV|nr:remorin 4.1 [Elaeis guineensis]
MVVRGGECGSSTQAALPTKPNRKLESTRPVRRRFPCERNDSLQTSKCSDDGRLPTVSEEQEDKWRSKNRNHLTMSSRLSSDDGYYTGSTGSGSGNNISDIESMIEERLGSMTQAWERPNHSLAAQTRRNDMENKLIAWKEARIMKLMNKLRKEAEAIDEWEKKQITKAKMDMKEFEIKLEKRRSKAMGKMQGKIRMTQKKAEKKKLKEQAAAAKKIATVNKSFNKISSTGKLPWMLVFL